MSFEESRRVLYSEAIEISEGFKQLSDNFRKDFLS